MRLSPSKCFLVGSLLQKNEVFICIYWQHVVDLLPLISVLYVVQAGSTIWCRCYALRMNVTHFLHARKVKQHYLCKMIADTSKNIPSFNFLLIAVCLFLFLIFSAKKLRVIYWIVNFKKCRYYILFENMVCNTSLTFQSLCSTLNGNELTIVNIADITW